MRPLDWNTSGGRRRFSCGFKDRFDFSAYASDETETLPYGDATDPISTASLSLNGHQRWPVDMDSRYFRVHQPYVAWRTMPSTNIYTYSFALEAAQWQPTSHLVSVWQNCLVLLCIAIKPAADTPTLPPVPAPPNRTSPAWTTCPWASPSAPASRRPRQVSESSLRACALLAWHTLCQLPQTDTHNLARSALPRFARLETHNSFVEVRHVTRYRNAHFANVHTTTPPLTPFPSCLSNVFFHGTPAYR